MVRLLNLNFPSLTLCIIFRSLLFHHVISALHLLITERQSFPLGSVSSKIKAALLRAPIALLHAQANRDRYYLSLNGGKKLNNPWGCRVGDYEAAKLC